MKLFLIILCAFTALVCVIIALALWLGGPGAAPPMPSIKDPFKSVDFSDMPDLKNYLGADGAKLFYREYAPQGDHKKGSAVLVHGSSGSSESLHPMATFLGHTAPNYRPDSGGWVSVGVPRIVALNALNAVGIRYWNDLPVVRFALTEEAKSFLTPEYDFNLNTNFAANPDYRQDLMNAKGKVAILAGDADELLKSQELQGIVQRAGKDWPVQLLPGIGHIPLTLDKAALKSVVELVIH